MPFRSSDLLRLLRDFGEDLVIVIRTEDKTYDPSTGVATGPQAVAFIRGYFYNFETMNVDQVQKGTRRCVISAIGLDMAPEEGDTILGNPDVVTITSVMTIFNQGVAVCYICDVRE